MNVIPEENNDEKDDGCGVRLLQRSDPCTYRKSRKLAKSSNAYTSNYTSTNDRSIDIMPQKTYIFWLLILIIFFIAAVNFTILIVMMSVLRIGEGMESIEILSKEKVIKFYGDADFDYVLYSNGVIKGFQNLPLQVEGNEGDVFVSFRNVDNNADADKMKMSGNEISFTNVEKFYVVDPLTQSNIFSTDYKEFRIPKGLPHLDVKRLRVKRLISGLSANLTLKSDEITRLRGNEGIDMKGKEIAFIADGDIYLNSVNGSIYLLADNIRIDMKHIPFAFPKTVAGIRSSKHTSKPQFKLCVCMPQGYLFKVPIVNHIQSHLACRFVDLSSSSNPCAQW